MCPSLTNQFVVYAFEGESAIPEFSDSICGMQSIREVFGGIQV